MKTKIIGPIRSANGNTSLKAYKFHKLAEDKGIEKHVKFKNNVLFLEPMENIDSVSFRSNQVKLHATLIYHMDKTKKENGKRNPHGQLLNRLSFVPSLEYVKFTPK